METLTRLLESAVFGNLLNIVGIILTVIGFWVTIRSSWKARDAAELAQREVAKVRNDLRRVSTVADFSQALALVDDIKRLHRDGEWPTLLDKYSTLKSLIITIRSTYTGFSDDQKTNMQSAVTQLTNMENQLDKFLMRQKSLADQSKNEPPNVARLNSILIKHADRFREILVQIQNDIGG